MGVVRDVTVDNLVTAVGNIDTSSLAQDSTLQDVVTAIGNISGGSDPVTNTTVNSLCKDTTGQSIASAISGLAGSISPAAANVTFNNTGTGLSASNAQSALVELDSKMIDHVGNTVTVIDSNFTSGTVKNVTIPSDGWYYVLATTGGTSDNCSAYIYQDDTMTTFIAASTAPPGSYQRTTTPLIPFKAGTNIAVRIFFNRDGKLCKLA